MDSPTGPVSGYECIARNVEWTWQQGRFWPTDRHIMMFDWDISGSPPPKGEPQMYRMSFSTVAGQRDCTVKGCKGREVTRIGLHVHFLHRHMRDTMVIREKGNLPHPRLPSCDMLVPWSALNGHHPNIAQYANGVKLLLQVELLPRVTKRKPVICRLSQQRHHYLTC